MIYTRRNFLRTLGIGAVSLPVVGLMPEEPRYIIQSHTIEPMGEIQWSSVSSLEDIQTEFLELRWENAKRVALRQHELTMEKLWSKHYEP